MKKKNNFKINFPFFLFLSVVLKMNVFTFLRKIYSFTYLLTERQERLILQWIICVLVYGVFLIATMSDIYLFLHANMYTASIAAIMLSCISAVVIVVIHFMFAMDIYKSFRYGMFARGWMDVLFFHRMFSHFGRNPEDPIYFRTINGEFTYIPELHGITYNTGFLVIQVGEDGRASRVYHFEMGVDSPVKRCKVKSFSKGEHPTVQYVKDDDAMTEIFC